MQRQLSRNPFDQQIINLGERGLTEQDAIRVIECDDEKFLTVKQVGTLLCLLSVNLRMLQFN